MASRLLSRFDEQDIRCIGCACTELLACADTSGLSPNGTCFWVAVDEVSGRGICSSCAVKPISQLVVDSKDRFSRGVALR
jgi:hypothetical protein